ncbi:Conserved hypothetical protein specific to cyanobacteria [Synechococcus sp. RCC307]|nr:Conserved hypothetical protein specific to cyanobacteria [Synechococcus sp. RCC307]
MFPFSLDSVASYIWRHSQTEAPASQASCSSQSRPWDSCDHLSGPALTNRPSRGELVHPAHNTSMLSAAVASATQPIALQAECTGSEQMVSFQTPLPGNLAQAMSQFIEAHPQWDQYRLMQAALAGFLLQQGVQQRDLTRRYVSSMFGRRV